MRTGLRHAGRAAAGLLSAASVARLGMPALAALVFLAVLLLAVVCWVIGSGDRSDRVTRMIYARRGDARCLGAGSPAVSLPTSRPRRASVRPRGDAAGKPPDPPPRAAAVS